MIKPSRLLLLCWLFASAFSAPAAAQPQGYNYDEAKVPSYELPDPLSLDGKPVTADEWPRRRAQLLQLFEQHVYGKSPEAPGPMQYEVVSQSDDALDGAAVRKEVDIWLSPKGPKMRMLLHLPARPGKWPVFLGLNFQGNHTTHPDPAISITESWVRNGRGTSDHRATAAGRGAAASRWPLAAIIKRGYGVATIYYGDIDPDVDDGFKNGVHPAYAKPGQDKPGPGDWGSIAAWAWGLSRGLGYLEGAEPAVDGGRVAVLGHSRLGKTALWAGATDPRFAIVISNNSGCEGAALSRRRFGETVKRINTSFPHWFCDNFNDYNDNEDALPVDQHELIALIAPRPVYVASATGDRWADPRGEFLAALGAAPVYRLLGKEAWPDDQPMPQPMQPLMTTLGYHLREGKHDITEYDWQRYMDFADKHYK